MFINGRCDQHINESGSEITCGSLQGFERIWTGLDRGRTDFELEFFLPAVEQIDLPGDNFCVAANGVVIELLQLDLFPVLGDDFTVSVDDRGTDLGDAVVGQRLHHHLGTYTVNVAYRNSDFDSSFVFVAHGLVDKNSRFVEIKLAIIGQFAA